jgi:hypothetical protein
MDQKARNQVERADQGSAQASAPITRNRKRPQRCDLVLVNREPRPTIIGPIIIESLYAHPPRKSSLPHSRRNLHLLHLPGFPTDH